MGRMEGRDGVAAVEEDVVNMIAHVQGRTSCIDVDLMRGGCRS